MGFSSTTLSVMKQMGLQITNPYIIHKGEKERALSSLSYEEFVSVAFMAVALE